MILNNNSLTNIYINNTYIKPTTVQNYIAQDKRTMKKEEHVW